MTDLMVDIETLGTSYDSVIVSIGVADFNMENGKILGEFYFAVDPKSCQDIGMSMDVETVLWWMNQPNREWMNDPMPIGFVIEELTRFIEGSKDKDDFRVWANAPQFDLTILKSAYRLLGMPCPWTYRQERDLRTLKSIYKGPRPRFQVKGDKHYALYDAKLQAKICSYVWRKMERDDIVSKRKR